MSEWRAVPGYEGLEISSTGQCRRLERLVNSGAYGQKRKVSARTLKPSLQGTGYYSINIWDSKTKRTQTLFIHHLVANAFIGPRQEKMYVLHKDGNPTNNNVENLRYGTAKENSADARSHGTQVKGETHGNSKLTEQQVIAIRQDKRTRRTLAQIYGVSMATIAAVKAKRNWAYI